MAKTVYLIRLDSTYARITNIVADPVLVNMTGKGEPYRDIPNVIGASISHNDTSGIVTEQTNTGLTFTSPMFINGSGSVAPFLSGTLNVVEADDVSHIAPRQGDQEYTFWKFTWATVAGSPTYTYAEFRRGDIIADTAPNTDPTP